MKKKNLEHQALSLLRSDAPGTLPLHALHGALKAEIGPTFGTYGELGRILGGRPDLFLLLEPTDPLGPQLDWPPELRAEYEAELRAAGVELGPRVALAETGPPWPTPDEREEHSSLERIDASILGLWAGASGNVRLRAFLADALRETEEIRKKLAESSPSDPHPRP